MKSFLEFFGAEKKRKKGLFFFIDLCYEEEGKGESEWLKNDMQ
jgi:hypothetical protein